MGFDPQNDRENENVPISITYLFGSENDCIFLKNKLIIIRAEW